MSLITCKECGKEISNQAKTCPHCGFRPSKGIGKAIGLFFLFAFIAMCVFSYIIRLTNSEDQDKIRRTEIQNAIVITAEQLYKEYDANEIAADQRYKNKILRVTGSIRNIGKTSGDAPYVNLATGKYSHQVLVTFPPIQYDSKLATYTTGSVIEVTGTCKGQVLGMVAVVLR
jgi:hypothetical protein